MAKILIADDNRDLADTVATLLEMSGFEVAVAYNGEAALAEAKRAAPDTAILDIAMPFLDGIAVAARLREAYGARIRLLALTALGDDTTRARVADAGFDDLLVKPASIYQIVNTLRNAGVRGTN